MAKEISSPPQERSPLFLWGHIHSFDVLLPLLFCSILNAFLMLWRVEATTAGKLRRSGAKILNQSLGSELPQIGAQYCSGVATCSCA